MDNIESLLSEAVACHQAGKLTEAEALYRRVLDREPGNADALHLLGVAAHQNGFSERAVELIGEAISRNDRVADYHNNLAEAKRALGRPAEALQHYRRALDLRPGDPETHTNLANALLDLGQADAAAVEYRLVLGQHPDFAAAHYNLGNALARAGQFDAAVAAYRQAVALRPEVVDFHNNLGHALDAVGESDAALAAYRRALDLDPDHKDTLNNLALLFQSLGRLTDAEETLRRLLARHPDHAEANNNLGNVLLDQARIGEAMPYFRRAIEARPGDAAVHSNLLFALHYDPAQDSAGLLEAHRAWAERHAAAPARAAARRVNTREPDRTLTVGYVSADLRQHPVGWFLLPVLADHDRHQVKAICYSGVARADDITAALKRSADGWVSTLGVTDEALAERIRADGIDILVDLSGHTAGNRLSVFAGRPAPVQVSWAGYFDTTGMKAIDCVLSDPRETPLGAERWFVEEVARLPDGYICYAPPRYAPAVAPLPAGTDRPITFGCFNNLSKVNKRVVALWSGLLRALPESRLLLKSKALGDGGVADRIRGLFAARGVAPGRLILEGGTAHVDLLASYGRVDIALDPFPYSGGLTTCEALWMGVPVVTLAGEWFVSRHATSHLTNAGHPEFVAETDARYLEIALSLALDRGRLAEIRAGLRPQMAASPLCDGPRFTRNIERIYREMWRRGCERDSE